MSANIILSFTLLFGAMIALVCSVYVALIMREKLKAKNNNKEVIKDELI